VKRNRFSAMAYEPKVFCITCDKLRDAMLEVDVPGGAHSTARYRDLLTSVQSDGILECNWGALAQIKTKRGVHRSPLDRKSQSVWQFFCFECEIILRNAGDLERATWFRYECDEFRGDAVGPRESFFVVLDGKVLDDGFRLHGDIWSRPSESPSQTLVTAGIWEEIQAGQEPTGPHWSNQTAWEIGHLRDCYRRFYEETPTGRVCALAPGNRRFDEIVFWAEEAEPDPDLGGLLPDPLRAPATLNVVAKKLDRLAARVDALASLAVRWLLIIGMAIMFAYSLKDCLK
jgi:hypothetical protein